MKLTAHIESVGLYAPGLEGWRDSCDVLAGTVDYKPSPLTKYKPILLPANERRRATSSVRTAFVAATFTAISHESLKFGFSWYATELANYSSTLGNLATVAVLFFWIYYEALVFILGGEVAQVYTMRKASRVGVVSFESNT